MSLYLGKNKVAGNITVEKESGDGKYLPLSGGTIDGDLAVNGELSTSSVKFNDDGVTFDVPEADVIDIVAKGDMIPCLRIIPNGSNNGFIFGYKNKNGEFTANASVKGLFVGDPTYDNEAANKYYVDNKFEDCLSLDGGTLTGSINVSGPNAVSADTIMANSFLKIGSSSSVELKKGTDENEDPSLVLSTGINDSITLSGLKEPKSNSDAANKIYVDSQIDSNKFVKDTNNISGQGVNSNMMIQDLIDIITEKVIANVNSINSLNINKANTNHTHDDRYYTESEVNNLLNGKANTIHITDTNSINISASNWTTSASGMKYFNSVTFSSLGITGTVIGCSILEWSGTQHLITCSAYQNNYIQFRAETATVATVRVRIVWI